MRQNEVSYHQHLFLSFKTPSLLVHLCQFYMSPFAMDQSDYNSIPICFIFVMRLLLFFLLTTFSAYSKQIICDLFVGNITVPHFKCIKQTNDDMIMLININQTGIDPAYKLAFINARSVGLRLQIVMSPCRFLTPEQHVSQIIRKLGQDTIQRVWVYPTDYSKNTCSWKMYSPESNCAYLQNILSVLKSNGFKTGVGAYWDTWWEYFGSFSGCPEVANELLGWVPGVHQQDKRAALEPYYKIGGWQKPYMKYFDGKVVCDQPFFVNYYE